MSAPLSLHHAGFLRWIDSLPEAELLLILQDTADAWAVEGDEDANEQLGILYEHRVLPDCDCLPVATACRSCAAAGKTAQQCGEPIYQHCEHMDRAHAGPYLSPDAQLVILRALFPSKYAEPREPETIPEEILVGAPAEKALVMALRAARGRALWHEADCCRASLASALNSIEDRIRRHGHRNPNGTDSKDTSISLYEVEQRCSALHQSGESAKIGEQNEAIK